MLRRLVRRLGGVFRPSTRPAAPTVPEPGPGRRPHPDDGGVAPPAGRRPAHDYDGPVSVGYAPKRDGLPDPGEVVWTWVPFEEDASVGKDRPVVVMGTASAAQPGTLVALMLSSKTHDGDERWMLLGAGDWDRDGRRSSVRLDRVLAVDPAAVRREGSALDRSRFDQVAAALRARHGWA